MLGMDALEIVEVEVGVALDRPPRAHEIRKVMVAAASLTEATLIASQMVQAHPEVVMVVSAQAVV